MILVMAKMIVPHAAGGRSRQRLPKYRNTMPIMISARSRALARRFRSRKSRAPQANDTTTDPRRIIETTEIMASASLRATK